MPTPDRKRIERALKAGKPVLVVGFDEHYGVPLAGEVIHLAEVEGADHVIFRNRPGPWLFAGAKVTLPLAAISEVVVGADAIAKRLGRLDEDDDDA